MKKFKKDLYEKLTEKDNNNKFGINKNEFDVLFRIRLIYFEGNTIGQFLYNTHSGVDIKFWNDKPLMLFGLNDFNQKYKITKTLCNIGSSQLMLDDTKLDFERNFRGIFYLNTDKKYDGIDYPCLNYAGGSRGNLYDIINAVSGYNRTQNKDNYFGYGCFSKINDTTAPNYGFIIFINCEKIGYLNLLNIFDKGEYKITNIKINSSLTNAQMQSNVIPKPLYVYEINQFGESKLNSFSLQNYVTPDTYENLIIDIPCDISMDNYKGFYFDMPSILANDNLFFYIKFKIIKNVTK